MGDNVAVIVAAMSVVFVLLEIVKEVVKRFVFRNGSGKQEQTYVVNCPNHIEGMDATLKSIEKRINRDSDAVPVIKQGVEKLVKDHAPDDDGVQRWKIQDRLVKLWEGVAATQRDMHAALRSQTSAIDRMVQAQERTIAAIENKKE